MEQAIKYLRELRKYVRDSSGLESIHAVYIPPAQQMRNAADEMERKDALLREIDEFLSQVAPQ